MNDIKSIDIVNQLGNSLCLIEKPGRYVGGEYGAIIKKNAILSVAIAFSDLYEIGMSNLAIKILYNELNKIADVRCERVFVPAPDFEQLLKSKKLPLFSLESKFPIKKFDILGISISYELNITGALSLLNSSMIPLKNTDRGEHDPIVIFGGIGVSNPAPFWEFADAFWMGEAEHDFFNMIETIRDKKKQGANRGDILNIIKKVDNIWIRGKKTNRAVHWTFGNNDLQLALFPIPSIRVVHDHAVIEIMRGCPNSCLFCQAGRWYRPVRFKTKNLIIDEVRRAIKDGGYRNISLSSLSSGDYPEIELLIQELANLYSEQNISFQFPSLKVSTFSLNNLSSLSKIRRAGLTFAIETPKTDWQRKINKYVGFNDIVDILHAAKKLGWRKAKFYFMVGLPVEKDSSTTEEVEIVKYMYDLVKEVELNFSINIGIFIPKPFTPFQQAPYITEEIATQKIRYIIDNLKHPRIRIQHDNPAVSNIEAIISRGSYDVSNLILEAFKRGCRLDSWKEHFKEAVWKDVINHYQKASPIRSFSNRDFLPWGDINIINRSIHHKPFSKAGEQLPKDSIIISTSETKTGNDGSYRLLFSYSKLDVAVFLSHLDLVEVFNKAFLRADIPIEFTAGFNPSPKLSIAAPIALGVSAHEEIASIDLVLPVDAKHFLMAMNKYLPHGLRIDHSLMVNIPKGQKKIAPPSVLWGFKYVYDSEVYYIKAGYEKILFSKVFSQPVNKLKLRRIKIFGKFKNSDPQSYFKLYQSFYN